MYIKKGILKRVQELKRSGKKTQIKISSRGSTITKELIDRTFQVYNGKRYITVRVVPEMVGHKFGEFSHTRKG